MSALATKTLAPVVTGLGVAAATGLGPTEHWRSVMHGKGCLAPITRFDHSLYWSKLAGEVPGFAPDRHLPGQLLPQTDHMTRLALVGADWALRGAGIHPGDVTDQEIAVVTAATGGGYEFGQRELQKLWSDGPDHVSAYQSFAWFYAVNTGQISIRHKTRGPGAVIVTEQTGGLDALGHARRLLNKGTRLALAGGMDSPLCPWAWVAHQVSGRLSRTNDPSIAYLPFDARAGGHTPGEGGAIMTLEDPDSAAERPGGRVYGRLSGYAATFDSANPERAKGLPRAMRLALEDAQMRPEDIDVVYADAAAIPHLDRAEADALNEVFGENGVQVTAPKTMFGRLGAGGAAVDAATALLSLYWGAIPPTINVVPDPGYGIDLVTAPRHQPVQSAMVLARGHGGFNSVAIFTKVDS